MLDPGRCSDHLRGCPFLGGRHALLRGGVVWDAALVSETGAFWLNGGLQHHFPRKGQAVWYAYVIAVNRKFLEARKTTGSGDGTRLWKLQEINVRRQGIPWSEELDGKKLHGARRLAANSTWS